MTTVPKHTRVVFLNRNTNVKEIVKWSGEEIRIRNLYCWSFLEKNDTNIN